MASSAFDHRHHYLVLGASGAQGGAVARRLLASGRRVRGFGRGGAAPEYARFGRAYTHATGDLTDPAAVGAAFRGITHASVVLPLVFGPETVARMVANIVDAAGAAGVERLVLNTGNRLPEPPLGDAARPVPAFTTRRAAAAALLASGVPAVVLRPPVYLENLCAPWAAGPAVHAGVLRYPLPADTPVAWLSHADLAAATDAALTRDGLAGRALDLGGADTVTGDGLAARLGARIGRDVRYEAQDADDFEAALASALGPDTASGVAATYRWAAHDPGLYATDTTAARDALGVRPTPLDAWLAAQPWNALAGTRQS
ncbi:NAD(P)H-binding protein [Streptomyces sp. AV19]|uniref:NmrA family NAD(P)-binding protein n=1 Tax=Streptomyces sp. AV19 TaxID=2793068 RepID=UPI0018FE666F|nr:NAD(P)H-binding protein [Streptomyces sp. AV19]MBH1932977.1 NAD(P)H-binding protein [Streptomyces sp. AV19]MDG4533852.1 NAD(P)H-binding protein [Streptomyces sp. AV19]